MNERLSHFLSKLHSGPIANSPRGKAYKDGGEITDLGGAMESMDQRRGRNAFEQFYADNPKFREFVDNLKGDEKVLDLGTGLGSYIIKFLKAKNKIGELYSLDLDPRNLKAQKDRGTPTDNNLIHADGAKLPFPDNSLDLVVEVGVNIDNFLNEWQKSDLIDQEVNRVLKSGGVFMRSTEGVPKAGKYIERFNVSIINAYEKI